MFDICVECDYILEDGEYLYKGKSYCDDCYRMVKKAVTGNSTWYCRIDEILFSKEDAHQKHEGHIKKYTRMLLILFGSLPFVLPPPSR